MWVATADPATDVPGTLYIDCLFRPSSPRSELTVRDREEVTNSELPSTARCCGSRRASSDRQRARVLAGAKARRSAPPPLRGAHGLDAGSAHARPDWLLPTMPNPDPLHVVVDELSRMTPFRVTVDMTDSSTCAHSAFASALRGLGDTWMTPRE